MSETLTVTPTEFAHILYRYDAHASRPPSARTTLAIQRWCVKRLKRAAREADCGLAYRPPIVETERDLSMRRTEYIVSTRYALLPSSPRQVLVVPRDPPTPSLNSPMHRT